MLHPTLIAVRAVASSVLLLALAGCGTQTPAGMWTLDTSAWPDCGWSDATMVYTNTEPPTKSLSPEVPAGAVVLASGCVAL
jgi:hypothetical protein